MTTTATHEQHDEVYGLIMAAWGAQVVRTLASLSVAEHLEHGPLTTAQIAQRAGSDSGMTHRVLRAGVVLGLLEFDNATEAFTGTSLLQILHEKSPFTLKHYAQAATGPAFWLPAVHLADTVRRGSNYVEETLGSNVWDYFAGNDDEARMFRLAMSDVSAPVIRDAVSAINAADGRYVVDVGGADGTFVSELLQANPHLMGTVLDLPDAMPGVAAEARRRGLSDRLSGTDGDFFQSVPAADLYLLKSVLHDWSDEQCMTILSNIRRAMNPGARLFIVEMTVANDATSARAALMDIAMLFGLSGREREIREYESLLWAADLTVVSASALHRPYHLIEAQAR